MRALSVGLFVLILLICTAALAQEEESAGFFKNVSGAVTLTRAGKSVEVNPGLRIMVGDSVITGINASAGLMFRDGTVVTLGAETEMEVRQYDFNPNQQDYDIDLFMRKGEIIYSSGKLGKLAPEKVNLKTPRATVGIRGTRFILTAK